MNSAKEPETDGKGEKGEDTPPLEVVSLDTMSIEQLRQVHEEEIGRAAHPQAKEDTLRAKIAAHREDNGGAA